MTRKIIDIRPVGIAPHLRLIADVQEDDALLSYSVEIDDLTPDELITYAVTDPAQEEPRIATESTDVKFGSPEWFASIREVAF